MKVNRFVFEYKNYLLRGMQEEKTEFNSDYINYACKRIEKYYLACKAGLITIRECMTAMGNCERSIYNENTVNQYNEMRKENLKMIQK